MRSYHGKNRRAVAWSTDGGRTFSDVTLDQTLIEPVCQASLIVYSETPRDRSRLLFSNPASSHRRVRMTVRLSYDEGQSWQIRRCDRQRACRRWRSHPLCLAS